MKKKRSGSIAIPFLLTFLISLIIIGGITMIIYDKIDSDNSSLLTMNNEAGSLSDSDSHTILFVLDLSDSTDVPDEGSTAPRQRRVPTTKKLMTGRFLRRKRRKFILSSILLCLCALCRSISRWCL